MSFKSATFLELLSEIIDNRGKTCPISKTGIPLIATNCIKNFNLYPVYEKVRYVGSHTYTNWFRGHPLPGDIIFVTKGSPGQTCWVPDPVGFCIAQDMVSLRVNQKVVYPKYLFALLRSNKVQKQIEGMHVGTLIPHFKKGDFDKLILEIHENYEDQKRIGDLYFLLSEKIELNLEMNKTLENIAMAIFKEWFVDFGPFRNGEYEDSELGLIPKGWKVCSLFSTAKFVNGAAFKSTDFSINNEGLPIIKISELKFGITDQTNFTNKEHDRKYLIGENEYDILFSWSGSPETSLDIFFWISGLAWLNQHIFKIIPDSNLDLYLIYTLKYFKSHFVNLAKDKQTTGLGHVTISDLKAINVPIPNRSSLEKYNLSISPIHSLTITNFQEIKKLRELRDYLLPKLISGEIRIKEAEDKIKEVI